MWKRIQEMFPALKSRKARVALATTIATVIAKLGFDVPDEVILSAVTLAVAVIFGIAIEDHGAKNAKRTHLNSFLGPSENNGDGKRDP